MKADDGRATAALVEIDWLGAQHVLGGGYAFDLFGSAETVPRKSHQLEVE